MPTIIKKFFKPEELEDIKNEAITNLVPSTVTSTGNLYSVLGDSRKSKSCFLSKYGSTALPILKRLATLIRTPIERFENPHFIRYEVGDYFEPHFDFFDPTNDGYMKYLNQGGQRVKTFIIGIAKPEMGGRTMFNNINKSYVLDAGDLLYFNNVDKDGKPCYDSMHEGMPVIKGKKEVLVIWVREGNF